MPAEQRPNGDSGFTLVELMVVMLLMTVVFSLCLVSIVSVQRSVNTDNARVVANDQVRLAVQQIDRQVRSGNIFYTPFDTQGAAQGGWALVVFTQANGNNRCVEWQVTSGGELQSRSWTQTWQTDGSPSVEPWITIATGITNTAPPAPAPFVLPLTTSYGGRILDINLATNAANSQSSGSRIQDSVEGRNTVYGYSASACSQPWPATS